MTTDDPNCRTDPTKGSYNGFSLNERFAASRWAERHATGVRASKPTVCHVCGNSEGMILWHDEDYRTPCASIPLCAWCHWTLHSRVKPRQAHIFPVYCNKLAEGWRPPPCPERSTWSVWRGQFLLGFPSAWPRRQEPLGYTERLNEPNLFGLVHLFNTDYVPQRLSMVVDGAPFLEGQSRDLARFPGLATR